MKGVDGFPKVLALDDFLIDEGALYGLELKCRGKNDAPVSPMPPQVARNRSRWF